MREKYCLQETDEEITLMTKDRWKTLVKKKIREFALNALNEELGTMKNGRKLTKYEFLCPQKYMSTLRPHQARTLFHVRTGTLDVKALRKYRHIVNDCDRIPRSTRVEDILTTNVSEMEAVADRCNPFCLESERTE